VRPADRARGIGRGAALVLALTALVIAGVLGTALAAAVLHGRKASRAAASRDRLLNVAESGVEAAISRLAEDPGWRGGKAIRVPGGSCEVPVVRAGDGAFEVTSRGSIPGSARACTVRVRLEEASPGLFRVAEWSSAWVVRRPEE
jgi:hypothetical protein